jgi:hypothetical protein
MAKEELRFLFPLVLVGAAALAAIILMLGYGPPRLPFDGQGSVTGTAYTGIGQLPPKFSPPWNVFTDEPFLSVDTRAVTGGKVNVTVSAEQSGMIFYKQFYVYQNVSGNYWLAYNFPDTPISGSKWIADGAAATVTMDASKLSAENYVLVYACTRDASNRWRCGCRSDIDTKCLNWSIQNYSLPVTTPPQYACTGMPPANATLCTGDDAGLAQDTAVSLVAACTAAKCEYACNTGYLKNGTKCDLDTSACNTTSCAGRTPGQNFCGADLTKIYVCTAASAGCLVLNANACGASASCQNSTGTALCLPCAATTPVASSIACGQNATGVLCSNNQPYKVNGTSCTSGTCTLSGATWSCTGGCTSTCTAGTYQCAHNQSCPVVNNPACDQVQQCALVGSCYQWIGGQTCNPTQVCSGSQCVCPSNLPVACGTTCCPTGNSCSGSTCVTPPTGTPDNTPSLCNGHPENDLTKTPAATPTSTPPQLAFDYGIKYLDPWKGDAGATGNCCGNNQNEWLLYAESEAAFPACCNNVNDCVDRSQQCYTENSVYTVNTLAGTNTQQFCWKDWWYTCDANTKCAAHINNLSTNYECYYNTTSQQYKWLPYTNTETCGDGIDNNCNGQVDEGCCGGHAQNQCPGATPCNAGLQACNSGTGAGMCYYCCADVTGTCGRQPGGAFCQGLDSTAAYYDPDCCGAHSRSHCLTGQKCGTDGQPCSDGLCWYCCSQDSTGNGVCKPSMSPVTCQPNSALPYYDKDC